MSNLYRLVYTSFRKPNCDEIEIKKILESCERNNPKREVTGVLMHSSNRFIQYIEGKKSDVTALYELIKEDDRHGGVNLRNMETIEKRVFPSWEMAYKDMAESVRFETKVSEKDRIDFEKVVKGEIDFTDEGMRILQMFFKMA